MLSQSVGGSSRSDKESISDEHREEESSSDEGQDEITETVIRKYLQAKFNSFCRLNAACCSRILHYIDASRSEWVNLLAVVHNDTDALFCVLLENPNMAFLPGHLHCPDRPPASNQVKK